MTQRIVAPGRLLHIDIHACMMLLTRGGGPLCKSCWQARLYTLCIPEGTCVLGILPSSISGQNARMKCYSISVFPRKCACERAGVGWGGASAKAQQAYKNFEWAAPIRCNSPRTFFIGRTDTHTSGCPHFLIMCYIQPSDWIGARREAQLATVSVYHINRIKYTASCCIASCA